MTFNSASVAAPAQRSSSPSRGRSTRADEDARDLRQIMSSASAASLARVDAEQQHARGDRYASAQRQLDACGQLALVARTVREYLARHSQLGLLGDTAPQRGPSEASRLAKIERERKRRQRKAEQRLCATSGCMSPRAHNKSECVACIKERRAKGRKRREALAGE